AQKVPEISASPVDAATAMAAKAVLPVSAQKVPEISGNQESLQESLRQGEIKVGQSVFQRRGELFRVGELSRPLISERIEM
ncbi:MAG: hypothetical protein M0Z96_04810, partial [Actinomycetota bacterium]|nr:hypothetical protein [Actinomycetota bacterium]